MSEQLQLSQIWRYPVKSLRGNSLESAAVDARGIQYDRQWMLVDKQGGFLTQREMPKMVLVKTHIKDRGLRLSAPGMQDLQVSDACDGRGFVSVKVWRDVCEAEFVDAEADAWLSEFLGRHCQLVYLPARSVRQVDQGYAQQDDQVGFADGFPFLLISQASLDDLNRRMPVSLTMERFRPNLVISGCDAYAEDSWRQIRIGELIFRVVKPCSRCVIPTIDPETGRRQGDEPLKTLLQYRKQGNKVMFGQNLLHGGVGSLSQGMPVKVLE